MHNDERNLKIWAIGILQAAARMPKTETLAGTLAGSVAVEKINQAIDELRAVRIPEEPIPDTLRPGA